MDAQQHIPVLLRESVSLMDIKPNGFYADGTLGRGSHSAAILDELGPDGLLFSIDRDPQAIELGRSRFENDQRVKICHGAFSDIDSLIAEIDPELRLDGVLLDLGVSSPQLDQAERGFSFMRDGALDMRMDTSKGETAALWLARVDEAVLVSVLFELGEERFARRIARAIIEARDVEPIHTTKQLAEIVANATPKKDPNKHPATRTFQAIRLHINGELDQVRDVLPKAASLLKQGGRLVVISFHSLEDRIVKRYFRSHATPSLPPKNIPVSENDYQTPLRLVGKAIKPSKAEVEANPRSRSAIMRVAERTATEFDFYQDIKKSATGRSGHAR
jgi:16S rRNA (cytosine1402-N4)-methyltransferase